MLLVLNDECLYLLLIGLNYICVMLGEGQIPVGTCVHQNQTVFTLMKCGVV